MEYRAPVYNADGNIDCEVNHPTLGWVLFTATPDDPDQKGIDLYNQIIADGSIDPYVPDPAVVESNIREGKKVEIKIDAINRVATVLPEIDTFDEILMMRKIYPAFTPTAAGTLAKDIYLYAKTKIDQADTAPIEQVEAYDPTTDTGWPS